jgi:hypothetical protein
MPLNLTTWADGFTTLPKEVVLRIFISLKNSSLSAGFEPANLGCGPVDIIIIIIRQKLHEFARFDQMDYYVLE